MQKMLNAAACSVGTSACNLLDTLMSHISCSLNDVVCKVKWACSRASGVHPELSQEISVVRTRALAHIALRNPPVL